MSARQAWFDWLARQDSPRVLEVGTRGWGGAPPKHHRAAVQDASPGAEWIGLDLEPGEDVDVVADVHEISRHFPIGHFSGVVCCAVLEHLRRPWLAAAQLAQVTRPGGRLFCQTHQSFPYHAYPADYFRFSVEALGEIFAPDAGWRVLKSGYEYPAKVVPLDNYWPHAVGWNFAAEAWLNVECVAERV